MTATENALVKIEEVTAEIFTVANGLEPVYAMIEQELAAFVPDVTTAKGRKEIASMAAKVARSKTFLDGLGKELVAGWKEKSKAVDADRRKMRAYFDAKKEEVRRPLTEWEDAERQRKTNIETKIDNIRTAGKGRDCNGDVMASDILKGSLAMLENFDTSTGFDEYEGEASRAVLEGIRTLKGLIPQKEEAEAEAAELARLRAENEAREKAEREERLRLEGEQRAREKMEREQAAKAKAEEKRRQQQTEAIRLREQDAKHRENVQREIYEDLIAAGLNDLNARMAINAMVEGKVSHVTVNYS